MLVAEKTHHINSYIYGQGSEYLVSMLQKAMPGLEVLPEEGQAAEDDEYEEISTTEWFNEVAGTVTPGVILRIRRENKGWTQAELSQKTGIAIPNISLMEAGKRNIGIRSAKKLADSLGCNITDFIINEDSGKSLLNK